MSVFVDTSALYALLDRSDGEHDRARRTWTRFAGASEDLVTTNYVVVETGALVGRRLGIEATREFYSELVPALLVLWVDAALHLRGVSALLTAGERHLSLVDCISFEVMRDRAITTVFGFDAHFRQQGFQAAR